MLSKNDVRSKAKGVSPAKIIHLGWLDRAGTAQHWLAEDCAFFPGTRSQYVNYDHKPAASKSKGREVPRTDK